MLYQDDFDAQDIKASVSADIKGIFKWIGKHYNQIILTIIALAFIAMAFGLFEIAKQIDRIQIPSSLDVHNY